MAHDALEMLGFLAIAFEMRARQTLTSAGKFADKERAIDQKLADTREQHYRNQIVALKTPEFQQVGADIRWQAWRHAVTRQLNMELARARAQKAPLLAHARRNLALSEAAKGARDAMQQRARQMDLKTQTDTVQDLSVVKNILMRENGKL